ncbi:MAG: hypothetical protein MI864_19600 [Pseudomonadales bacterium]|nr:hypothetical protein [Pseudomonadales bacterium]
MSVKLVLIVIITLSSQLANSDDIAIIVNPETPLDSISERSLRDIYLGRAFRLDNGNKLNPIELHNQSKIKEQFHHAITHRTLDQLSAHWARLMFTGKGFPINQVHSEEIVLEYVANNPDTIGYVSSGSVTDSVKVIKIIPE